MPLINAIDIKQIDSGKPETVGELVNGAKEPILLKGLVNDWPLVQKAQHSSARAIDYLRSFDADLPLTVYEIEQAANGRLFYNDEMSGFNFARANHRFKDVLTLLDGLMPNQANPSYYIGSTMLERWFPGLRDDNNLNTQTKSLASIWFGNQSTIAAHYDFPNNIACCVLGGRRFTLFAPEQIHNLYPGPIDFTPSGQAISMVDFDNIDYQQYPNFKQAEAAATVVELEVGDALYIPSMWWHQVESLEPVNALINFWWRSTPEHHGPPLAALQHALLALRDLPKEQREVWKGLFDHYVFDDNQGKFEHIPEQAKGVLSSIDEDTARAIRHALRQQLAD